MVYQFDNYLIDIENMKLYRDDVVITDEHKNIHLLCLLCEKFPEVVDKQFLIDSLWPEQVVTDWSLSKLVSDVRQLLDDSGKDQGYIKTVRGKGFRFVKQVQISEQKLEPSVFTERRVNTTTANSNTRWIKPLLSASLIGIISLIAFFYLSNKQLPVQDFPLRVAIIPVENANQEPLNEWVKYGIMSMASEQLARYESIQTLPVATVISQVASLAEDDLNSDSPEYFNAICGELGCTHVVVIKYSQESDTLPVLSVQVDDGQYRSAVSNYTNGDLFVAVDLLLDGLVAELIPGERERLHLEDTFSNNSKANRDYAIGVNELLNGDIKSAGVYLELALDRQPSFFWAESYLADVQYRSGELQLAINTITVLEKRQPNPRQTYFLQHLRSNVLYTQGDFDESLKITLALTENPFAKADPLLMANELINIGSSYQATGKLKQAIDYLNQSRDSYKKAKYGPGEGKALFNLANTYLLMSDKNKALDYYQKSREIFIRFNMPGYALLAKHQIATTSVSLGRLQYAEAELRTIIESYKKMGDLQGQMTAEVDMIGVSIAKKDYKEAIDRAETCLAKIEHTEFSYLNNYTRKLTVYSYLQLGEIEKAQQHFQRFDTEWEDPRVDFIFIPAHLMQASGQIKEAYEAVKQLKVKLGAQWSEAHEAVLKQFEESQQKGEITPIIY